MMIRIAVFTLFTWGSVTLSFAQVGQPTTPQPNVPAHVESHLDQVYARYGEREMHVDLFVPTAGTTPKPAALVVHGGGWLKGDKTKFRAMAQALAARGYVAAAIEYRLGGEAKFPAAIEDCHAAVRWLRANADRYSIDRDRIVAVGGSAGGHLVGLLATTAGVKELHGDGGQPEQSSAIQAAVVLAGPLDLASGSVADRSRTVAESNANLWIGKTIDEAPDTYRLASATTHLSSKTPSILFMAGEHDQPERNRATRDRLRTLGIATGIRVYKDGKHGCWNREPWFTPMVDDMDAFFDSVIGPTESPTGVRIAQREWGEVHARENQLTLHLKNPAAERNLRMPAFHNRLKSISSVDPAEPVELKPGTDHWQVALPGPSNTPSAIVIETVDAPRNTDLPVVLEQAKDGSISLPAHTAVTHGELLRYEPQPHKDTVGYWANENDWCEWHFYVESPRKFDVQIWQGCGTGQGGSQVVVEVGEQAIEFEVLETGHFQNFVRRRLGEITLTKAGLYTLKIRPRKKANKAVMDVRRIELTPVGRSGEGNFHRSQLVAWCIVPFDAARRGPAARAQMIRDLEMRRVAYDWRQEHVPTFEDEIIQYRHRGIDFFAFWSWHPELEPLIKKYRLRPQLWITNPSPDGDKQNARVAAAIKQLLPLVKKAAELECKVGLYNHGGWGGQPENLVAVCRQLRLEHAADHVGIVYNFHHAHDEIDRFEQAFSLMQPYLLCLNLNGMLDAQQVRDQQTKIVTLGEGKHEAAMIDVVRRSDYTGPIGILDHRNELDSRESLQQNLSGLEKLLSSD